VDGLGYRDDNGYPGFNLDKAREEVELYKQETGQDALRFVYAGSDDVDNLAAQQYLVDMWAEAGIEASVLAIPQADVIVNAVIGNYEATDWRNWAQPDPDVDYVWWHSSSVRPLEEGLSLNIAHFKDAEIDAALDAARQSTDEAKRDEAYATVAARMASEVPYLFLGRIGWAMASRPEVHGWEVATENGTVATIGVKTWVAELWIES
jgi:ABC-type transport system substrate-binding protein